MSEQVQEIVREAAEHAATWARAEAIRRELAAFEGQPLVGVGRTHLGRIARSNLVELGAPIG